VPVSWKK